MSLWDLATKAAFYGGCILTGMVSLLPLETLPETGISDKLEHFAVYAVLGLFGLAAHPRPGNAVRITLALCLYGAVLEGGQALIPGRTPSLLDAIANSAGAMIGVAVFSFAGKHWPWADNKS
ncbi:MAG: VanZ family protein [Rhodospirillales bacterium]|nr:VanZ family protein [Rhodospirillales bacterium]